MVNSHLSSEAEQSTDIFFKFSTRCIRCGIYCYACQGINGIEASAVNRIDKAHIESTCRWCSCAIRIILHAFSLLSLEVLSFYRACRVGNEASRHITREQGVNWSTDNLAERNHTCCKQCFDTGVPCDGVDVFRVGTEAVQFPVHSELKQFACGILAARNQPVTVPVEINNVYTILMTVIRRDLCACPSIPQLHLHQHTTIIHTLQALIHTHHTDRNAMFSL